jgi:hypothetical protein
MLQDFPDNPELEDAIFEFDTLIDNGYKSSPYDYDDKVNAIEADADATIELDDCVDENDIDGKDEDDDDADTNDEKENNIDDDLMNDSQDNIDEQTHDDIA